MIRLLLQKILQGLGRPASRVELDGKGERVDVLYRGRIRYGKLDMYQKSHVKRYRFAAGCIKSGSEVADLACGTGYGTVMLAEKARRVVGVDINAEVIEEVKRRYQRVENAEFLSADLRSLDFVARFDYIVSFETVEHLEESEIPDLFASFSRALKPNGTLIFSTPYRQPRSPEAITMGFHHTFDIDEDRVAQWTGSNGLDVRQVKYQNYQTHDVEDTLPHKDFMICVAVKR